MSKFSATHSSIASIRKERQRALWLDKLGVIAGFLVGLPVGLAVLDLLNQAEVLPVWALALVVALVVCLFTWVGMRLGVAVGRHFQAEDDAAGPPTSQLFTASQLGSRS